MDDIQQSEWTISNKQKTNKTDVSGEACQKQPLPSHFEKIISGRKKTTVIIFNKLMDDICKTKQLKN